MSNTLNLGTDGNWATKKNSLLAYNSENGNYKPLPFNFERAGSATRVNKEGLIEVVGNNEPRIDFTDNSEGALLLEPTRSNKVSTSNDFNGSGWNVSNLTATANQVISPDGTLNASKLLMTGDGSLRNQSEASFNDGYAYSIFVKKGNSRYVTIRSAFFTQSFNCGFDLDTLTAETNGKIEDYGNDWYRLSITKNISGDNDRSGFFYLYLPNSLGSQTSVSGNYAYFYGGQIEDGSYPTSIIPTSGSIGTRDAESSSQTVPDGVIGQTEGVLYVSIDRKLSSNGGQIIELNNGIDAIAIQFGLSNTLQCYVYVGASFPVLMNYIINADGIYNIAFAYKQNDFVLYVNGVQINSDTSGNVPSLNNVKLVASANTLIKEAKLYNTRLSNSELAALTSN